MDNIYITRKNGDLISSLDFGEVYFNPDRSVSKSIRFVNKSDDTICLSLNIPETGEGFPFRILIFPVDDDLVDESFREMLAESQQDNIFLNSQSNQLALVILSCVAGIDGKFWKVQANGRNSFSTMNVNIPVRYIIVDPSAAPYEIDPMAVPNVSQDIINLQISANICTSILYIDEVNIDFESCILGNTYVRDIQVWNRSECRLFYRLLPTDDTDLTYLSLVFSEFDNGKVIQYFKPQQLSPFSSKRIRCTFRAKNIIKEKYILFSVENINNPFNTILLNCHTEVKEKEEVDPVILESESGEPIKSGDILDLGDCYTGLIISKKFWIRNNSTETISLNLSSNHSEDISFDMSGHYEETQKNTHENAISKDLVDENANFNYLESDENVLYHPNHSHAHTQSLPSRTHHSLSMSNVEAVGKTPPTWASHAATTPLHPHAHRGIHTPSTSTKSQAISNKSLPTGLASQLTFHHSYDGGAGLERGNKQMVKRSSVTYYDDDDADEEDAPFGDYFDAAYSMGSAATLEGGQDGADFWGARAAGSCLEMAQRVIFTARSSEDMWDEEEQETLRSAMRPNTRSKKTLLPTKQPGAAGRDRKNSGTNAKKSSGVAMMSGSLATHSMSLDGLKRGLQDESSDYDIRNFVPSKSLHGPPIAPAMSSTGPTLFGNGSVRMGVVKGSRMGFGSSVPTGIADPHSILKTSKSISNVSLNQASKLGPEELVLKPGGRAPVTLLYCPSEILGSVESASRPFSWSSRVSSEESGYDLRNPSIGQGSSSGNGLKTAAKSSSGSLAGRSLKMFMEWRVKGKEQRERSDSDMDDMMLEHNPLPPRTNHFNSDSTRVNNMNSDNYLANKRRSGQDTNLVTRQYTIRARCCTSVITVTPNMIDLGECNVGEYRAAVFTIKNESDLPALVLPHVESETLAITEREVNIPPRSSKQVQFEYVARIVNTDYKREALLINAFNSHGNVSVEVRAKNIDSQQVLLHSLFYKIYTNNNKKQLQIFYDKCIYNMPNIRIFHIRNIFAGPLILELTPTASTDTNSGKDVCRCSDIRIYQIIGYDDRDTDVASTSRSLIGNKSREIEDLKWGSSRHERGSWSNRSGNRHSSGTAFPSNMFTSSQMPEFGRKQSLSGLDDLDQMISSTSSTFTSSSQTPNVDSSSSAFNSQDHNDAGRQMILGNRNNSTLNFLSLISSSSFPFGIVDNMDTQGVKQIFERLLEQELSPDEPLSVAGVKITQYCYRELIEHEKDAENSTKIRPVATPDSSTAITIPMDRTASFAVVFQPKSGFEPDELGQISLQREIQLKLLSVNSNHVTKLRRSSSNGNGLSSMSTSSKKLIGNDEIEVDGDPIKPRTILLRAKATRSELSVVQKNINFGRTTVGELSTMGVTIVNKSSVPLLFSISKSGYISSGFLRIPSGRKGRIPALASQTVEFAFRPTLPGPFEEVVDIENVLDPGNKQSVTIKARVHKPESFVLLPAELPVDGKQKMKDNEEEGEDEGDDDDNGKDQSKKKQKKKEFIVEGLRGDELDDGMNYVMGLLSSFHPSTDQGVPPQYLGELIVREPGIKTLVFRVRNTSSKTRNFIIDATHSNAVVCMDCNSSANSPIRRSNSIDGPEDTASASQPLFEPTSQTLQSICTVRCQFHEFSSDALQASARLTLQERKELEDNLEHFQQKLKIAYRKKKPEKIIKYEKKIKEAKAKLAGIVTLNTGVHTEKDKVSEGVTTTAATQSSSNNLTALTASPPSDEAFNSNSNQSLDEMEDQKLIEKKLEPNFIQRAGHSDSSVYHFQLGPEKESIIQVRVTLLPGTNYDHWPGPLPFQGSLRVLEAKNEDIVKFVRYGAMVYSSKKTPSDLSNISTLNTLDNMSEDPVHENSHPSTHLNEDVLNERCRNEDLCDIKFMKLQHSSSGKEREDTDRSSKGQSSRFGSKDEGDDGLGADDLEICPNQSLFLPTVPQWSSLLTRDVIPWYKDLNEDIFAASLNLVQVSRGQSMQANFSIEYLTSEPGQIDIWFPEDMKMDSRLNYSPFIPKEHGPISFAFSYKSEGSENLVFSPSLSSTIQADSVVECILQWVPRESFVERIYAGYVGIRITLQSNLLQTQYIPIICYHNHASIIKIDKNINFGEIPLGSTCDELLTLTNISEKYELVYKAWVIAIQHGNRGNVEFNSGKIGAIEPLKSKTISLNFSGTSLGKFEQELLIQNVNDMFDQKRIALTAFVTWPQSEFISLPDFELNEKGKWSRWDLGLIQAPAFNTDSNWKPKVFQLHMINVSGKILFVTAVPNLKKQCFIYVDEACTKSVLTYPLPTKCRTTFYVVIRPSNVPNLHSKDGGVNSQKEKRDREEMLGKGRELAGGIRFIFFPPHSDKMESPTTSSSLNTILSPQDGQRSEMSPTSDILNQLTVLPSGSPNAVRKLFETSIMFQAQVGSSILKGKFTSPRIRTSFLNSHSSRHGFFKGILTLYNASPVFPLEYMYEDQRVLGKNHQIHNKLYRKSFRMNNEFSRLYIIDDLEGSLQPLEQKYIEFLILIHPKASGFVTHSLKICNKSTTDYLTINQSIFIDCCTLVSSIPKPSLTLRPEALDSSVVTGTGLRLCRDIIPTEIETINCDVPVWVGSNTLSNNKQSSSSTSVSDSGFLVIGSSSRILCRWDLMNGGTTPLIITPVSDLPIQIYFEDASNPKPSRNTSKASNYLEGTSPSLSSRKIQNLVSNLAIRGRSDDRVRNIAVSSTYTSIASLPEGTWRQGLHRCGNTFTIPAGLTVSVIVEAMNGTYLQSAKLSSSSPSNLEAGKLEVYRGVVAFVTAAQALQSFFDPSKVGQAITSSNNQPTSQSSSYDAIPVASYTRMNLKIVCPNLSLPKANLPLGTVRKNRGVVATFQIQNSCDVDLPIRIENTPVWMEILRDKMKIPVSTTYVKWWLEPDFLKQDQERNDMVEQTLEVRSETEVSSLSDNEFYDQSMSSHGEGKGKGKKSSVIVDVPARSVHAIFLQINLKNEEQSTASTIMEQMIRLRFLPNPVSDVYFSTVSTPSVSALKQINKKYCFEVKTSLMMDSSEMLEISSSSGEMFSKKLKSINGKQSLVGTFHQELVIPASLDYSSPHNGNSSSSVRDGSYSRPSSNAMNSHQSIYKNGMQITIRNISQDFVRVQVQTFLRPEIEPMMNLDVIQQAGLVPVRSIDLVPGESANVTVISMSKTTGRIPDNIQDLVQFLRNESETEDQTIPMVTSPRSPLSLDGVLGPILFGNVRLIPKTVQLTGSGTWPSSLPATTQQSSMDSDEADDQDTVTLDIVGTLKAGPIVETSTTTLIFCVDQVNGGQLVNSNRNVQFRSPKLSLREDSLSFTVRNSSASLVNFKLKGYQIRKAGMRLQLDHNLLSGAVPMITSGNINNQNNNQNQEERKVVKEMSIIPHVGPNQDDDKYYDTVSPFAFPQSGLLCSGDLLEITVRLGPGLGGPSQLASSENFPDGSQLISGMKLKIWDTAWKAHPPQIINISLRLTEALSVLLTEPAMNIETSNLMCNDEENDREQDSVGVMHSKTGSKERSNDSTDALELQKSQSNSPLLKIRGVTPCAPHTGQYEICLGQQPQRKEALEWSLTIGNTSEFESLQFRIYSMSAMDESWLELGQRRGDITPGGVTSVTLYFSRIKVGIFFTYVVIQNISHGGDVVILRVSLEVVQDHKYTRNINQSENHRPLFLVKTALGPRVLANQILLDRLNPIVEEYSNSVGIHTVDFTDVYLGKLYRRRSFVIINTSDISLDFKLSSTFPTSDMMFTLSPISLKPCHHLTVDQGEKRQVFVVFCPSVKSLLQNIDVHDRNSVLQYDNNPTSEQIMNESVLKARPNHLWKLEGEIFIACRLVKDHQESVKVYGRCRKPTMRAEIRPALPPEVKEALGIIGDESAKFLDGQGILQLFSSENLYELGTDSNFNYGWISMSFICVECTLPLTSTETLPLSIYTYMQSFEVTIVGICDATNVVRTNIQESRTNRDFVSIQLHGGDKLWLQVRYLPNIPQSPLPNLTRRQSSSMSEQLFAEASGVSSNRKTFDNEITNNDQIIAEEHFTIYNRYRPSEKVRMPVRLISAEAVQELRTTDLNSYRQREGMSGVGLGSTSLFSFSGLEGAISRFLKDFTAFWPSLLLLNDDITTLDEFRQAENTNFILTLSEERNNDNYGHLDFKLAMQLIGEGPSNLLAKLITTALKILETNLNTDDEVIVFNMRKDWSRIQSISLIKSEPQYDKLENNIIELSQIYVDLLFRFFALTDELALHTLRQSSLGNALMSSVHTGQPAARLAQLLYTVALGHPIFESFGVNRGQITMPITLVPFAKELLYYMSFFPEVDGSMEPLLDICGWVKAAIRTNEKK